ncbi:DUF3108 domain-containing protein [Marinilabilia rubra]|uniref:DUF3108 domain-containing protein n=1 Tax=Marinilabilia rubra TaxID=2162893 RepID=A0A2U2BBM6_9BACT|nr:DUF3108 domain-containing protein [Marinilabilia rubra]PWE00461.1 DUF3108 domain-containing protein [Marinilabilia rubra]
MTRYTLILILALMAGLPFLSFASSYNGTTKSGETYFQQRVYGPGEELRYSLNYGFIKGGEASLMVKDTTLHGEKLHHVIARGKTVGLADAIYKVRDRYESFIDPQTDLPVKSVRSIREGSYRYYNEVSYEHQHLDSAKIESKKSGEKWVPENIQDILSAFYYARKHKFNEDLKEGELIEIMTYFSDELFPLRIRYKGVEVIDTPLGDLECYKFVPVTEVGRAFKNEDDMQVWISRDKNRVPVRIRFQLRVGAFTCNLEQFRGLHNPFSSFHVD